MGTKGWFESFKFLFFNLFYLCLFTCINVVFLVSSMPTTPDDYDPFATLKQSNFSNEDYQDCFKYFDFQR